MSEFKAIEFQNKGDSQVRTANLNRAFGQVNLFQGMQFDGQYFRVIRTAKTFAVTLNSNALGATSYYPYRIYTSAELTCRVTQGSWTRNHIRIALGVEAGEEYKELSGLAQSRTYYVYLTLTLAAAPAYTPLTNVVTFAETVPADTALLYHFVIGTIVTGATVDGVTPMTVTQLWHGYDITDWNDNSATVVDNLSINTTGGSVQDYGWATAVDETKTAIQNTSLMMLQTPTTRAKAYVSWSEIVAQMGSSLVGTGGPWETSGPPKNHATLNDLVAGTSTTDSHNKGIGAGNNVRYIKDDGNFARNAMQYGLGDFYSVSCVNVGSRTLDDAGGSVMVDWKHTVACLYNGGAVSLDWKDHQLEQADWSVTATTDASAATVAAFKSAGGIAAAGAIWSGTTIHADTGFQINASNYWTTTSMMVSVTNVIDLASSGPAVIRCPFGGVDSAKVQVAIAEVLINSSDYLTLEFAAGHLKINGSFWQEEDVEVVVNGAQVTRTILRKS